MAILAASMTVPVVAIRQKPDIISISVRRPGVEFVQRCHRRVNIWSLFLAQQIFHVVLLAISYVFFATGVVLASVFRTAAFFLRSSALRLRRALYSLWDSKTVRRLRKKIVFEFMVVILGPGNMLFVLAMWPGWLFLGFILCVARGWMVSQCTGGSLDLV